VAYQDAGRILTVLTPDLGKVTVSARGAVKKGSRVASAVQPLAFSDMTLLQSRERWTLTEAQTIELFAGLAEDIARLSLGSYFAELLEVVSDEDCPGPDMLSLGLNALYLLSEGARPPELVKAAFETRLMCLSGYAPRLAACAVCGAAEPRDPVLDVSGGAVTCLGCAAELRDAASPRDAAQLCAGSLDALRHIASCEAKRVFAFTLGQEATERLVSVSEKYILAQLDRRFRTLDYYHSTK
jgi:DNA repair protein RecO (recombination protein O)